ncbi:surface protein [Chryseobacterium ginsenosidimutans]|uniref:BspA family leucine-rich repeat surface protein n=1 Tax=Chryseobacterium ginsenosidimutans TaxID=687846 RepID=UPI002169216E|nr:BspA family leucine-rich repeat surface protein [Chryseobacterium ginsenosidimutans]MCS3870761.1 surface protein [Chryseobacterium ginsenosidimutans]
MLKKLLLLFLFISIYQITKAQNEFITTWKPSNIQNPVPPNPPFPSSDTQVWMPVRGTNFTIYWEESGYPAHNATLNNVNSFYQVLLDFGTPFNPNPANATYIVKVSSGSGNFHRILFRDPDTLPSTSYITGDTSKITEINQWGDTAWSSMKYAFTGCGNLNMTATDLPNLSLVSDMSFMFMGCPSLVGNQSINNWKTSSVTLFTALFNSCANFNQPIGNWDTHNVTSMAIMFLMAQNFNQPIGNWDTSNVTEMTAMFHNAKAFNQSINNWDVSHVLDMEFMFIDAWTYNQEMGNWNTSEVIEMNNMFMNAKTFNQNIGNWNTSKALYMHGMFGGAIAFNQNIGNWDTSKVINMGGMFNGATAFNQDIGNWDTSNVVSMNNMFTNATQFNQDLGKWNLSDLTVASGMLQNSGLNCQNYDKTLYGWRLNPATPNNINMTSAFSMVYSHPAAVAARNYLVSTKGWTILGDSYNSNCASFLSTKEADLENNLSIYPNPATDFIYVKNLKGSNSYKISDASGRIILQNVLNEEKIDVSSLMKGNYILQIIAKDKTQNFKFIKK